MEKYIFRITIDDVIPKFYVLCGFDRNNKWDYEFWIRDIFDLMKRICK